MRNDNIAARQSDLELVAEKTYQNSKKISQNDRQRRDEFVDLYGIEFARNSSSASGGSNEAKFRVSISGDAAYMERFQFKVDIEGFQSTAGAETGTTSVKEVADTVSGDTLYLKDTLTPDPHKHSIIAGTATIPVTTTNWRVVCEGVDITANLMAQCVAGGWTWFNGEGVFPSTDLEQSFDMLEVASDFEAAGDSATASKLLRQGWKPISIIADQPFYATMVLYLKYQHMNR